ncbi:MAG: D,D-transpeptidase PbpA [Acidimicrobiia bacterium]|nr:MAG: D,D-transpeptidase PbpA [Acidimicrobiia bacterium]
MNVPLRRTAYAILGAFLVLIASATYIQAVEGPSLRDDARNPRVVAWRTGRQRGPIMSADGKILAESAPSETDSKLYERAYPEGDLYAHTVGFTSVLYGSRGIERTRSTDLVSNRDATISGVLNGLLGGDTKPRGVRLTLNHALQQIAAEALGNQKGSVVAIDPATGAVLAMVTYPRFDPNDLVGPDAGLVGEKLDADPNEPLRNRAIDETYAPGSVFKVITTASGLDAGLVSPSSEFADPTALELPGSDASISNYNGKVCDNGTSVKLELAFVRSCNTVFAQLGMDLGGNRLGVTSTAFGFNVDIPFELAVLISFFPPSGTIQNDPPATAQSAIGQRDVRATPLLMALTAAAVANGGNVMTPYLVDEVFTSDGTVKSQTDPSTWRRTMSPASASVLSDLMEQVVISGTGRKAAVPGIRIAGKTGTTEVTGKAPHAWFIGFGPVGAGPDIPQIAIAVIVESGGDFGESATGGSVAAPIAQQVLAAFFGV